MNKKGFTLVELMVVIVIIGVLAAVAIPRLMESANKARASEGPQILGAIVRMQHARSVEHSAAPFVTLAATATNTEWQDGLGMSQPSSRFFTFATTASGTAPNMTGFTAVATIDGTIGRVTAGNFTTTFTSSDNAEARTTTSTPANALHNLAPNWAD
jgi:prepilin-type N-terminal cleavage/methylation domain-containing protein